MRWIQRKDTWSFLKQVRHSYPFSSWLAVHPPPPAIFHHQIFCKHLANHLETWCLWLALSYTTVPPLTIPPAPGPVPGQHNSTTMQKPGKTRSDTRSNSRGSAGCVIPLIRGFLGCRWNTVRLQEPGLLLSIHRLP